MYLKMAKSKRFLFMLIIKRYLMDSLVIIHYLVTFTCHYTDSFTALETESSLTGLPNNTATYRHNHHPRSGVLMFMVISVCMPVCNESHDLESSFVVCRYMFRGYGSSSYMKMIRSRSRSQAWNVIFPPQAEARAWLQLQWRQVHFTHSGHDTTCLRARMYSAHLCTATCARLRRADTIIALHIFRSADRPCMTEHVCVSCSRVVCLRVERQSCYCYMLIWNECVSYQTVKFT